MNDNKSSPIRLTIQCPPARPRNDSMSTTCSSAPLSPSSFSSSPFSPSPCPSSSLSPMSSSPPVSPLPPKTPVPADSPLFSKPPLDTKRKRYKSFSRDIRRSRRTSQARSIEKSETPGTATKLKSGDTVTFIIKKHQTGKEGWKIMPEDQSFNINASILAQAVNTVRQMLYAGHDIPDKMTLVIQ